MPARLPARATRGAAALDVLRGELVDLLLVVDVLAGDVRRVLVVEAAVALVNGTATMTAGATVSSCCVAASFAISAGRLLLVLQGPSGRLLPSHRLNLLRRLVARLGEGLIIGGVDRVVVLPCIWVVVRVVEDDVGRQAFDDPFVLQAFVRRETLLRIPLKASANEVDEGWIWHLSQLIHDVAQSFLLLLLGQDLKRRGDGVVLEL